MCEIGNYIMLVFLVLCSASDLRTRRIPIVLLIAMSAFMSILYVAGGLKDIPASLGGFAVGIAFYLFSRCSKEAIGYGDSWIILLIGIQLGMYGVLGTVFTAFFIDLIDGNLLISPHKCL